MVILTETATILPVLTDSVPSLCIFVIVFVFSASASSWWPAKGPVIRSETEFWHFWQRVRLTRVKLAGEQEQPGTETNKPKFKKGQKQSRFTHHPSQIKPISLTLDTLVRLKCPHSPFLVKYFLSRPLHSYNLWCDWPRWSGKCSPPRAIPTDRYCPSSKKSPQTDPRYCPLVKPIICNWTFWLKLFLTLSFYWKSRSYFSNT